MKERKVVHQVERETGGKRKVIQLVTETINFLLRVRDVGLFARQGREKRFYTR